MAQPPVVPPVVVPPVVVPPVPPVPYWKIQLGDRVTVKFASKEDDVVGTVLSMPAAVGEPWVIDTTQYIVYILTFQRIIRKKTP